MKTKKIEKTESPSYAIEQALLALEDERGCIDPEAVIAAASSPDSPLHDRFEWDDTAAAHQHRIYQARALIRGVIVLTEIESHVVGVPKYIHDSRKNGDMGYVSLDKLASDPPAALASLRVEFARALACLKRAEAIADSLKMKRAVRAIVAKINVILDRVAA